MPEISRFFGIVIRMYFNDHAPPQFHVEYGTDEATIEIRTLELASGRLSKRVLGLVLEWAFVHRRELEADWELARERQPLARIEPLH